MDIDRLIMTRFLGDTVMALRANQNQMDARTRFGVSLYLAGAASALADQHGLTPDAEHAVLSDALGLIGHTNAVRESFFSKYDENMDAIKNREIIQAGESAMRLHLKFADGPAKGLGSMIEKWHKPGISPALDLGEVFLLTYANIPHMATSGSENDALDRHNRSVRKVLSDCNGLEVRHTGKGIFARFEHPDDAICAAIAIQQDRERQKKSESPPPPTRVAIVASHIDESNPDISGKVFSHSDILCRRLSDGRIACDAALSALCTIEDVTFDRTIPDAHSGITDKEHAVEILWNPLPV